MGKDEKLKALAGAVRPGMYYYSDGTISSEVLSEKQISGVIGWVDESGEHGLVLGLREAELKWSGDDLVANAVSEDGKENTRLILKAAQKQNKKAEAAEWCAAYAFDGVRPGEAFLASREELRKIFRNLGAIQEALEKINQPQLEECACYWSSSKLYDVYVWRVMPSVGTMYYYGTESTSSRVRCAFAF